MKKIIFVWIYLWIGTVQASPAAYQITQGFSEGATAIAQIIGDDIDGDGWLTFPNEITSWSMVFTGNSIVPPFEKSFVPGSIPSLRLSLFPVGGIISDGPVPLTPDEFFQNAAGGFSWRVTTGCTTRAGTPCTALINETGTLRDPDDFTFEAPLVSLHLAPIPAPATVWLFGSGLIGLIGVGRRIHQNSTIT